MTPRYVTLALAAIIIAGGAWLAFAGGSRDREPRRRLIERRKALFAELASLEQRARTGGVVDSRRQARLVSELEQVYGELDDAGLGPQGGGKDVAA